jgi:hypothetical protein
VPAGMQFRQRFYAAPASRFHCLPACTLSETTAACRFPRHATCGRIPVPAGMQFRQRIYIVPAVRFHCLPACTLPKTPAVVAPSCHMQPDTSACRHAIPAALLYLYFFLYLPPDITACQYTCVSPNSSACWPVLPLLYRVAAIFPEHFQSFTVALKNLLFY